MVTGNLWVKGRASTQASRAMEILRDVFDQRPFIAAEELAKATLVQARCLTALDQKSESANVITDGLTLLLPLIEPHRIKLSGILREMHNELKEIAPQSLAAASAANLEASLKKCGV